MRVLSSSVFGYHHGTERGHLVQSHTLRWIRETTGKLQFTEPRGCTPTTNKLVSDTQLGGVLAGFLSEA